MVRARWFAALMTSVGLSLVGCGPKDDHVACYPVNGKVLLGDQPAEGVKVLFYNSRNPKNVDAPQPYGMTDASGQYTLSTFDEGDGAPADDYVVVLLWPEGPPGPGPAKDRLGNAYTNPDTTPFKAIVAPRETKLEPFKIDPDKLKKKGSKPPEPPVNPAAPPG